MCMYCGDSEELNFDGTFYCCNTCGETFNKSEIGEYNTEDVDHAEEMKK